MAADRDWDSPYFSIVADFVYTSTPTSDRGLRDVVVKVSKEHLEFLLNRPEFESVMEENGDFGKYLVKAIADKLELEPDAERYQCGGCASIIVAWLNPTCHSRCPSCGNSYSYRIWSS
jgi:speckle-type POZ protein